MLLVTPVHVGQLPAVPVRRPAFGSDRIAEADKVGKRDG